VVEGGGAGGGGVGGAGRVRERGGGRKDAGRKVNEGLEG